MIINEADKAWEFGQFVGCAESDIGIVREG